jgi:hypothetical protein
MSEPKPPEWWPLTFEDEGDDNFYPEASVTFGQTTYKVINRTGAGDGLRYYVFRYRQAHREHYDCETIFDLLVVLTALEQSATTA